MILLKSQDVGGLLRPLRYLALSLVAVLCLSAAQAQTIRGKVTDETGAGLPGVNIIEKGTSNGTVSDAQGDYSINAGNDATLVFSFIGYTNQEIAVGGRASIDVKLEPSAVGLSEVVVVGYGAVKKTDITGAIGQVSDQSLRDVTVANATQALQGRVAGVDIQPTSSRPGGGAVIRIRGSRSFSNDANDPLIVVDGIPFNGTINDLNTNDIVSMNVLKDASATAIYGSRGASGVIIVTTRAGRKGKPTLFYDGSYGVSAPVGTYSLMNGEQFWNFRQAAVANGASFGPTTDELNNRASGKETDWQKEAYKNGYITNHSIGVNGGSDDTQYSVSGGYFKQSTVLPGQAFTRYSLSTKIDQKVGDRVTIGLSTQNTLNITDGENVNPIGTIFSLSPLYNAYNADGTVNATPAAGSIDAGTRSPLLLNNQSNWKQQRNRLRTFNRLYGEVKIIEGLKYRINIGLDYFADNFGQYFGSETPFQNGAANTATVQNTNSSSYTVENLLTWDKTFANVHRINVTGLYSFQAVENYMSGITGTDIPSDANLYYNVGLANNTTVQNGTYTKWGLISWMGRVNYSFNDKISATITMRRDGSSRLAPGHQYLNYPAAAVAWNIQKESFMSGIEAISTLKLRIGAGRTASQSVNPYSTLGQLSKYPYNFGDTGLFGYGVTSLPSPNLSWETTTTYNFGLDFGILTNKITGSVDYYQSYTEGVLQQVALPATSGVTQVTQNVGKNEVKGFEVTLSASIIEPKVSDGFAWSVDANWFLSRSKITDLGGGRTQDLNNGWYVGYPVDAIYDYTKIGIWQTSDAALATAQGKFVPGQIRVKDIDGNNVIDTNDRSVIGSLQPDFQYGLTNRLSFKGLTLDVILFGKQGGMLVSTMYQANSSNPVNTLEGRRNGPLVDYWTPTNPTNAYPRPGVQQPIYGSTLGYFDASFMKIRSINLGYQIPQKWIAKTGITSLKVYFQAMNPFKAFFSPYVDAGGLDPEPTINNLSQTNSTAIPNTPGWKDRVTVGISTPPVKQFIFGVNIRY